MAPDGTTFAIGWSLYDSVTRSYQAVRRTPGDPTWLALSKNGRFGVLLFRYDPETKLPVAPRMYRWDRAAKSLTPISRLADGTFLTLPNSFLAAVSEDGGTVAFAAGASQELWIWKEGQGPTQKTPVTVGGGQTQTVTNLVLTPDGSTVYFSTQLRQSGNSAPRALVRYSPSTEQFSVITSSYPYSVSDLSVSDDGSLLCFERFNQSLPQYDVAVVDTRNGTLRQASVSSSGTPANANSNRPQISGNGRYVVFDSDATNLVSVDFNGAIDVFRHDLFTGQTRKLSVLNDGGSFTSGATSPGGQFVSTDGSRIYFRGAFNTFSNVWDENGALCAFAAVADFRPRGRSA